MLQPLVTHNHSTHRAAERILVLHSAGDGILNPNFGNSNRGRPVDAVADEMDSTLGFFAGAYPRKYGLGVNIRQHYTNQTNSWYRTAQPLNDIETDNLRRQLTREATQLNQYIHRQASAPYTPLPEPELLLPWGFFAEFTPERIDWIMERLINTINNIQFTTWSETLVDSAGADDAKRNQRRDKLNNIIRTITPVTIGTPLSMALNKRTIGLLPRAGYRALGWQWNEESVRQSEALTIMLREQQLDEANQTGILFSHSGMRVPSQLLFEKVFQDIVLESLLSHSSFGDYE